jgi:hypothetical protein
VGDSGGGSWAGPGYYDPEEDAYVTADGRTLRPKITIGDPTNLQYRDNGNWRDWDTIPSWLAPVIGNSIASSGGGGTGYAGDEIVVLPPFDAAAANETSSLGIAAMIVSRAVTGAGLTTGAIEMSKYYKNPFTGSEIWKGKNGVSYTGKFGGNATTGGKLSYARAGSAGIRIASRSLFVAGAAISAYHIGHGYTSGNTVEMVKGSADLAMGVVSLCGPVGLGIGVTYFGVTTAAEVFVPALTENYVKHRMDPSNF